MRAFKASCNIISDRRRGGCSPRACVAGKTMHHMCTRRRRGIGGAGAGSAHAYLLAQMHQSVAEYLLNREIVSDFPLQQCKSAVNFVGQNSGPFLGINIKKSLVNIKVHQLESCLASDVSHSLSSFYVSSCKTQNRNATVSILSDKKLLIRKLKCIKTFESYSVRIRMLILFSKILENCVLFIMQIAIKITWLCTISRFL